MGVIVRNAMVAWVVSVTACVASEMRLAPPADGGDAVPLLREAVQRCKAAGLSRLVLEKGIWHLYPERAVGMYRHISNHDACYRRVALHLEALENFELDGQGSTLLCHEFLTPVAADCCRNLVLRNFTVDWNRLFHLEGTVGDVGEDGFEVEFLPESQVSLQRGMLYGGMAELFYGELMDPSQARQDIRWNYWIDPRTRAAALNSPPWLQLWNEKLKRFAEITEPAPGRYLIRYALASLPETGTVMVCKGMNRQNRLAPAIHLSSVDGVRVENVTVHHAGGMGVIAEDCTDPVVQGLRVALKAQPRSLITTTADATHFVGCYGTVRVENCLFENMLDDSCNVHGVYAIAEGLLASNRLAVSFSHFQQLGTVFARPGDRVRLTARDTLLGYAECGVQAVERPNDDYYVLTVDRSLADAYRTNSSLENLTARPDVVYRGNTVRNNRSRGLLVTSGGRVLVENNRFERPSAMHVLVEGDNNFWYESGGVEDMTIRKNVFVGHNPAAPVFRLAPLQPKETRAQPPYHRNIRIVDNDIEAAGPLLVEASRVSGLTFASNRVTFLPGAKEGPAFKLKACENVTVDGNESSRPLAVDNDPSRAAPQP